MALDAESTTPDPRELQLPVFVLFAAGDLWSYPATRELDSDLRALPPEDFRAWDCAGRRLRLVGERGKQLLAMDPGRDDKPALQSLLLEKLRERHVAGVDTMSFDELVYKASIRFVIVRERPWWQRLADSFPFPFPA